MATEVIMPALGMAQETGKVLKWLKAEGDLLVKGEPLVEIETDKVTVEIESPADGMLGEIWAVEETEVPVGTAIAVVLAAGESLPERVTPASRDVAAAEMQAPRVSSVEVTTRTETPERRLASPKARRIAESLGVDISTIAGSGPNGTVVASDVEALRDGLASGSGNGDVGQPSPRGSSPVGSVWRVMAERTTRAWQQVPQFVLQRDVDVTRLTAWLADARERDAEKPSVSDLLVKICAEALRLHPGVNASWQDDGIALHADINIGLAVATDEGLLVPVIHSAEAMAVAEISLRRRQMVASAREGSLRPSDVSNGTFTISNLGMFGVDRFQAIVNAPQAAILAVGRISQQMTVQDGSPSARPILTLSVTFDHRVVDGARGAEFLRTMGDLIEEPTGVLQ